MVQVVYLILSIISFILKKHVLLQGYVGDFCTLHRSGEAGQCQLISNCPTAVDALHRQGIPPQTCSFDGWVPIVCCVGGGSGQQIPPTPCPNPHPTPRPPRPTQATAPPTPPTTHRPPRPTQAFAPATPITTRVGQKSEMKCKEYQQYAYPPRSRVCAIEHFDLVVGGRDAKPKEFAHMALLGWEDETGTKMWQCGGSLISERFVLTAGHCLYDSSLGEPKYVRLGELQLNTESDDAQTQEFLISEAIGHPEYKPPSRYNDIALLKLDKDAKLSVYVRPVCLYTKAVLATEQAMASGWGRVGYMADSSDLLQKVVLDYFNHSLCSQSYKNDIGKRLQYGIVDESQICAGSSLGSKDTCQGDSGGPLQVPIREECIYHIVGVVSFGKGCGFATPGVYTRVSHYIGWIESIVWP